MAIEILRPNAAGDEENISNVTGDGVGTHYTTVDEETPDDDTTYVRNKNTAYERDLYNIADNSAGSGTINSVTVYARCKGTLIEQASLKIAIKSTSAHESAEKTITTDWANYSEQWATNPDTGSAWTWDEIDGLQIGISIRESSTQDWKYTYCTQVYVEVDYTPAETPKSSSDAGSGVDAYVSLETPEAKSSSDTGSGVEVTPVQSAVLAGNETGSGIEALIARLLTGDETGTSIELGALLRAFFASELGRGSDSLTAKIETPIKGGGMKLWN